MLQRLFVCMQRQQRLFVCMQRQQRLPATHCFVLFLRGTLYSVYMGPASTLACRFSFVVHAGATRIGGQPPDAHFACCCSMGGSPPSVGQQQAGCSWKHALLASIYLYYLAHRLVPVHPGLARHHHPHGMLCGAAALAVRGVCCRGFNSLAFRNHFLASIISVI
jgi:hypothetical protein